MISKLYLLVLLFSISLSFQSHASLHLSIPLKGYISHVVQLNNNLLAIRVSDHSEEEGVETIEIYDYVKRTQVKVIDVNRLDNDKMIFLENDLLASFKPNFMGILVWNYIKGKVIREIKEKALHVFRFGKEGLFTTTDKEINIWNYNTGALLNNKLIDYEVIESIDIGNSLFMLLCKSKNSAFIQIWDSSLMQEKKRFPISLIIDGEEVKTKNFFLLENNLVGLLCLNEKELKPKKIHFLIINFDNESIKVISPNKFTHSASAIYLGNKLLATNLISSNEVPLPISNIDIFNYESEKIEETIKLSGVGTVKINFQTLKNEYFASIHDTFVDNDLVKIWKFNP